MSQNDTDLLHAITDAILHGRDDVTEILEQADVAPSVIDTFVTLIQGLHETLGPHEPSERFVRQLKRDLVGEPDTLANRVRSMPGRVHIATGLAAAAAGVMWLVSRRDSETRRVQDVALQQS